MKLAAVIAALALGLALFSNGALADETIQHYEAKPSDTLEEAVRNFSEYNKRLAGILSQDKLTQSDMEQVHQLTYTLEVALAKINEDMTGIVDTLEEVHLSSEEYNEAKLRGVAEVYLEVATTVIP